MTLSGFEPPLDLEQRSNVRYWSGVQLHKLHRLFLQPSVTGIKEGAAVPLAVNTGIEPMFST